MRLLDAGGILATGFLALLLSWVFRRTHAPDPARILIALTAAVLVLLHLFYVQLNDTYLTALVPFALLAAASWVDSDTPTSLVLTGVMACVLASSATCLWVRAEYSRQQAEWKSADLLVERGVQPQDIAAPLHWAEYHGAFDEWTEPEHPVSILRAPVTAAGMLCTILSMPGSARGPRDRTIYSSMPAGRMTAPSGNRSVRFHIERRGSPSIGY